MTNPTQNLPVPVVLCILDGWGLRTERANNAVALANTPNFDRIMANCPNATLKTSGLDVGLPDGQMGNSEVGHMNIGAGRVVSMDLGMIDNQIASGGFNTNPSLADFIDNLKMSGGTAHLLGIVSDGGVHGHVDHMIAAANTIAAAGVQVNIHCMTDGRDVPPGTALEFLQKVDAQTSASTTIATVSGRYYAMDRDNRWERVKLAYEAIVKGNGEPVSDVNTAIAQATGRGETDEFFTPSVLQGYGGIKDGDGVFCLNFRADRAREILSAIGDPDFDGFDLGTPPILTAMLGMADYSSKHDTFMTTMYPKKKIVNTLGAWVSKHGKTQFRLAETEKYPHVTFFLNGGIEPPEEGEDRFMPASPKVATYDLQPEMSSAEVTDQLTGAVEHGYDLIVVNYANPDMVGHTGDLAAAIAACEAVDTGLGKALEALEKAGGAMIVTADHGNCETMVDPDTGNPHTAHTTNPVPVVLVVAGTGQTLRKGGRLADLAPTLLFLMGLPQPTEMTGTSLIE